MIQVKNSTIHYINERALTFSENDLNDPQRVAVSLVSGTVIMAYVPGTIDYAADGNYERWTLKGYSTKLVNDAAHYIYARLSRTDRTALIVFSVKDYNIDGSITTVTGKDENDNDITETTEPSTDYFYIKIGELTATDGTSSRELTYDSGLLSTAKGNSETGISEMWELDKYSMPWLIKAKQWLASFTVRGFIMLVGGLIFKKGEEEKVVTDIKRSTDSDENVPLGDESLPTSGYLDQRIEELDDRFLRKDKDDRSSGKIASDKGFEVGEFNEGTLGSGASIFMRDGSSYSEVDFLKVRKKATFTNITIQELKHVGGEIILSPAAMVVSKVEELEDGYKCYFDTTDYDGRKVYSYFEVGDQARCQTFNLDQNQYYWRLVTEVNEEDGYIVLSKTDCDKGSGIPKEGDNISQLGNRTDSSRQSAIILSAYGSDAPSYKQYSGVGATEPYFSLDGKQVTRLSPYGNELTGVLNIEKGSKGWENFEGLPEEIQKAADAIESIEYGKNNLLLNSGFTGDYVTASLVGSTNLKDTSSMFSPSLKHWDVSGSVVVELSEVSESGYEVSMYDDDVLEQTLYTKVVPNDNYIFSFRGKGGAIRFTFGDVYHQFDMDDEIWGTYSHKFQAPEDVTFLKVEAVGDCNICELQLERGNVRSAWGISPLDNRSELAKYDSLTYLKAALKGETDILGGLINTGLINMGMYDEQGNMTKSTAGINGLYNEDRSIAFWAGGNSEQAAFTEATYLDNPNYIPTQEELSKMAKFVVTHGGRAILNDIILRGYIYALGGIFKGAVDIAGGKIKLNADGSGQLADGAVEWNKYGIMYRKSHENVKWVNVSSEFSESMIIDLKKGTYLDLTEGLNPNPYILPDSEYDGVTLSLLWTHASRSNQPAVLSGNFKAFVKTNDEYTQVSGNELTLAEDGIEYELTYDSKEAAWVYIGHGVSIEGNRIVLGKVIESKTDVQAESVMANSFVANGSYGLTKVVTIYGRDATYTLNFTAGILTGVNETYDS